MELILNNHESSSLTRRHHHPTKVALLDGHSEAGNGSSSSSSSSSLSQSPLAQLEQQRDECLDQNDWKLAFVYAQHVWCWSLKEHHCDERQRQRDVLTSILHRLRFGGLEISKYLQILQQYTLTQNSSNEHSLSYWNSRLHFFDSSLNGLAGTTIEAAQVHTRLSQLHDSKSLGKSLLHARAALKIYKRILIQNHPDRILAQQRVQRLKQSIVDEQQNHATTAVPSTIEFKRTSRIRKWWRWLFCACRRRRTNHRQKQGRQQEQQQRLDLFIVAGTPIL